MGCNNLDSAKGEENLLAVAFGEKLYLEDLDSHLKNAHSSSDSQFVKSRFIDEWVMDKILYEEAQKRVGKNKDIESLVDSYRKSLYIYELDNELLSEELNRELPQEEIDTFYSNSKSEFSLQEDIVRFLYIKIPESSYSDTIKDLWKTEELPVLKNYVSSINGTQILNPEKWYYKSELKNILPELLYRKISFSKPNSYSHTQDETKFFVKILEKVDSNKDAPVSFVEETIRERILHDKAKDLLRRKRKELYDEKIQNKNIQIF